MDEADSLKITVDFGLPLGEVAKMTPADLEHIAKFLETELNREVYKAMEEEIDRQIYAANNHHIPEGALRSILSTSELLETNKRLTSFFDAVDRNALRYWGKRLFNKRCPEWLSDVEIARIYDEVRKKHERKRNGRKTNPSHI